MRLAAEIQINSEEFFQKTKSTTKPKELLELL